MYTIGIAAKRSGVGIEAIRYYERERIVPAADRAPNGRRMYDDALVAKLRFVRRCRDLGFSIADVKALLALSRNEAGSCEEAKAIAAKHRDDVQRKILDLQKMEVALTEMIGNCADGKAHCPLLRRLFED